MVIKSQYFDFGVFTARIQKSYLYLMLFILLEGIKKNYTGVLSDSEGVLEMTENIKSWSRTSLLGCILFLFPAHPPSIMNYVKSKIDMAQVP